MRSLYLINHLKSGGNYVFHQVYDLKILYFTHSLCFCVDLRTKSDYFTVQH
jgi:hypothetical protein